MDQMEEEKFLEIQPNEALTDYECMVCFELCKKAIECQYCHKLFCLAHVQNFQNKCPNCRSSPFKYHENVPMQKVIEKVRKTVPIKCSIKDCGFSGVSDEFLQHAAQNHQVQIIKGLSEDSKEIYQLNEEYVQILQQINVVTQMIRRKQGAPQGEVKKEANQQQMQAMNNHVSSCQNQGCTHVWRGRWGPFIGGDQGATHFDLTECPIGKPLNQAIGWNYNDPRH